jgi:hypothetical protein
MLRSDKDMKPVNEIDPQTNIVPQSVVVAQPLGADEKYPTAIAAVSTTVMFSEDQNPRNENFVTSSSSTSKLARVTVADEQPSKKIRKREVEDLSSGSEEEVDEGFSVDGLVYSMMWNSLEQQTALDLVLGEFSYDCKQTLMIKITTPARSSGWAINICPFDDNHFSDIYFHFNPRFQKSVLIMNDKQGVWGMQDKRRLDVSSKLDAIISSSVVLIIQITSKGFIVYANGQIVDYFPHRREIEMIDSKQDKTTGGNLFSALAAFAASANTEKKRGKLRLIVNPRDGNGNQQEMIIHKV